MDTITAITERRAVKHYDPDFEIPAEDETKLLELARLAPTSFNIQNWRFVNVKDKDLREQIKEAAWGQAHVADASLLIIMCADLKAYEKEPSRYWSNTPQEVQDILVPMIVPFYDGNDALQHGEAHRSCGLAGQTLMLAAKAMGYDSCPMVGFDQKKVAELIRLPENHVISFMIAIGKEIKPAWPRPNQIASSEAIVVDRFEN
ncbi:nitroreductase family protein [Rubellicoccus peritrichatus]|uniref:Nitroreductase family protein n=1 Tax=Rubellicoccus peritrichatus TaxID=3080537 RepID=A0AAQ3LBI3_9BACT|nr:nitroreductase family protein [Puniceicoccus sp. CR14]WOO42252.1 nitroreductase family protein [Puniceicoccus sp. CR14]